MINQSKAAIKVGASSIEITSAGIKVTGKLTINDIEFMEHKHTAPAEGGETSGVIK